MTQWTFFCWIISTNIHNKSTSFLFIIYISKWFHLTLKYLPWTQNHRAIGLSKGSGRPEVSYQVTLTLGYVLIQHSLPISKLQWSIHYTFRGISSDVPFIHTFSEKFSNLKVNRWWYNINTINFMVGDNRLDNYATLHFISFLILFMSSVIVILNTFWSRN